MMNFYPIAEAYKQSFYKDSEGFLMQIGKFKSIQDCLCIIYHQLIRDGECEPLEKLDENEKRGIWQEAKRVSEVQDQDCLVRVCKAIHALGQYLQI